MTLRQETSPLDVLVVAELENLRSAETALDSAIHFDLLDADERKTLQVLISLEQLKKRTIRLERMLEEMALCGYQRAEPVELLQLA